MKKTLRRLGLAAALLTTGSLAACGDSAQTAADGELDVITSSYSTSFVAERVLGDAGAVIDLMPAGGEAHDLELSPRQVAQVQGASFVFYLGDGFQPAVEQAVAQRDGGALDGMDLVPDTVYRDHDPHVWLSPMLMAAMGDELAVQLGEVEPGRADQFAENAAQLRADLEALDQEFQDGLADCQGAMLLTSHEAFGYMADAYGIEQSGVMGINPEAEPSPKRLREITELANSSDATTLFIESSDTSGEKLAASLGMDAVPLHTLEVAVPHMDYIEAMRANLAALQQGLNCAQ